MYALHARYRGRDTQRAELVRRSAKALSTLHGVGEFEHIGIEDIVTTIQSPDAVADTTMALLSVGDWAVGIGISSSSNEEKVKRLASQALGRSVRPATVRVKLDSRSQEAKDMAEDISATFAMIAFILTKRTDEGRQATSLMRTGLNQNEAAQELNITKQAMSQRLQAAGWQAEQAGWNLAVHLLHRALFMA